MWGGGARRRQEACWPVAGAGATQYRSLFGGMGAADLLLELGRREGGFVWRTVLMLELLLQVKRKKEKKVEPSGSPGPIPVQPDSGPIHRTRPDQNHD